VIAAWQPLLMTLGILAGLAGVVALYLLGQLADEIDDLARAEAEAEREEASHFCGPRCAAHPRRAS